MEIFVVKSNEQRVDICVDKFDCYRCDKCILPLKGSEPNVSESQLGINIDCFQQFVSTVEVLKPRRFEHFFKFEFEVGLIQTSHTAWQGIPSFYSKWKVGVLKNSLLIRVVLKGSICWVSLV